MNPSTSLRNPKQKPIGESTLRNSQQLGATQHILDPYTVYVSGNYVVKFYDEYADVSKLVIRGVPVKKGLCIVAILGCPPRRIKAGNGREWIIYLMVIPKTKAKQEWNTSNSSWLVPFPIRKNNIKVVKKWRFLFL